MKYRTTYFTVIFFLILSELLNANLLFISEYSEGSSNNKYIELFNPGPQEIDLSQYTVKAAYNGGDWSLEESLTGTLKAGECFVLSNPRSDQQILDKTDLESTMIKFNGDDVIGLFINDELIDVVGEYGQDPGSAWPVYFSQSGTKDHTLIRNKRVMSGNINWTESAGNENNSEWDVKQKDDWSDIGKHTIVQKLELIDRSDSEQRCYGDQYVLFVECNTDDANYTWYKDEIEIVGERSPAIFFSALSYDDSGIYHCVIKNDISELKTEPILLNVLNKPEIISQDTLIVSRVGEKVTMTFNVHLNGTIKDQELDIQWFKNDIALEDDGRFSGVKTETLVIQEFHEEDKFAAFTARINADCELLITDPIEIIDYYVEFDEDQQKQFIICNHNELLIQPKFKVEYDYSVEWYDDAHNRIYSDNEKIIIKDDGELRIKNYYHTRDKITVGVINFIVKPKGLGEGLKQEYFIAIKDSIKAERTMNDVTEAVEGSEVVLEFKVNDIYDLTKEWYHYDKFRGWSSSDRLVINNASKEDEGDYFVYMTRACNDTTLFVTRLVVKPKNALSTNSISLQETILFDPYPNPSKETSSITFYLKESSTVILEIIDTYGHILTLKKEHFTQGKHQISLDLNEHDLVSGSYIIRLRTHNKILTKHLSILR